MEMVNAIPIPKLKPPKSVDLPILLNSWNQCYFSSRNHLYSSFYSVHNEINSVLVQFPFFFTAIILVLVQYLFHIILVLVFVLMPQIILVLVQTSKS